MKSLGLPKISEISVKDAPYPSLFNMYFNLEGSHSSKLEEIPSSLISSLQLQIVS